MADLQYEYWLRENAVPIVHKVHKEGLMRDSVAFHNEKFFSFYNWGFSDDDQGYEFEMIVGDGEKATHNIIPFYVDGGVSVCDENIRIPAYEDYGINNMEVPTYENKRSLYTLSVDMTPVLLMRVDQPVIDNRLKTVNSMGSSHVCYENKILPDVVDVDNKDNDEDYRYGLEKWNIHDKTHDILLLKNDSGEYIDPRLYGRIDILCAEDDFVYAHVGQGLIVKIHMDTGIVEHVNEPLEPMGIDEDYRYSFTSAYGNDAVYQFIVDRDKEDDSCLRILDVETGKEKERFYYSGVNEIFKKYSTSGMAVNPRS
ncbi:MAG: hypothetical protein J6M18_01145 [Actinomycetaceae bacterium]|nr:hypothetical protein [Actinomycetaceae bacterium]